MIAKFVILAVYLFHVSAADPIPTIRVVTNPSDPWIRPVKAVQNLTSNQFEGYLIDLLEELKSHFKFNYDIHVVKDGHHGQLQSDGIWNGMVGELVRNESDIAVADFTITDKRLRVIDFTVPFMSTGIGIVVRRPPYYVNPSDIVLTDDIKEGGEVFRPLVFYPIESVKDLANQTYVDYGSIAGGSTYEFFKDSTVPVYKHIFTHLVQNKDKLPKTNIEGIDKVIDANGAYAMFMEGTAIHYHMGTTCAVKQLGKLLNRRSYGIGMRIGFEHKAELNFALLKLLESDHLNHLKHKWFPVPTVCDVALHKVYMRNALNLLLHTTTEE